jgi:hypothetical protein
MIIVFQKAGITTTGIMSHRTGKTIKGRHQILTGINSRTGALIRTGIATSVPIIISTGTMDIPGSRRSNSRKGIRLQEQLHNRETAKEGLLN